MASVNKCPYCGADVRSDEKNCPGCGAPNELYVTETPAADSLRPKTMEELLDFAAERHMPLERMRFFVGKDYREPRAFGVYRDANGNYIVYKNKANGERAVRYSGPDEARAVGELYDKLLSECHNRGFYPEQGTPISTRVRQPSRPTPGRRSGGSPGQGLLGFLRTPKISLAVIALLLLLFFSRSCGLGPRSAPEEDPFAASGSVVYEGEDIDDWEYEQAELWDDDRVDSWESDTEDDWEYEWTWDSDDTDWESDW